MSGNHDDAASVSSVEDEVIKRIVDKYARDVPEQEPELEPEPEGDEVPVKKPKTKRKVTEKQLAHLEQSRKIAAEKRKQYAEERKKAAEVEKEEQEKEKMTQLLDEKVAATLKELEKVKAKAKVQVEKFEEVPVKKVRKAQQDEHQVDKQELAQHKKELEKLRLELAKAKAEKPKKVKAKKQPEPLPSDEEEVVQRVKGSKKQRVQEHDPYEQFMSMFRRKI